MKFRELRKSKNMTQCQLASAIGVKQSTISNWEGGISKPMTETIIKLSKVFGCSMQAIFECFI